MIGFQALSELYLLALAVFFLIESEWNKGAKRKGREEVKEESKSNPLDPCGINKPTERFKLTILVPALWKRLRFSGEIQNDFGGLIFSLTWSPTLGLSSSPRQ